jgi:hypothetical protein
MGITAWTRETLTMRKLEEPSTTVSVSSPSSPYACAKRRRERRAARERTRRRRMGIPAWTRETLTKRLLWSPLTTIASLPSPPYARAKRRRERQPARAVDATTDADPGMDAGDADVEGVGEGALDDDRVVAAFSLRAALRRRRAADVSDAGRSR